MSCHRPLAVVFASVLAIAVAARPADAQDLAQYDYAYLGLRGIGVEVLYVDPSQSEGTIGYGARIDLGFLGPHVRVVPRFAYWNSRVDSEAVEELERQLEVVSELPPGSITLGSIDRSAYVLGADLQYIGSAAGLAPYAGIGIDVYALNDEGNAIDGTFLDDIIVTAGVSAVFGLQAALAPSISLFAEARATAVTDASSLGGAAGLMFTFGP